MGDRADAKRLQQRRLLAVAVLVATSGAFLMAFHRLDGGGLDAELELAYVFAGLMVLGTLGFGLALMLLRCPRCGRQLGRDAAGRFEITGQSLVDTLVALIRPMTCPDCGFDEREARKG